MRSEQLALDIPAPRFSLTRIGRLAAIHEAKRAQHPELARRLTWRSLQRICAREGVRLHVVAMEDDAQLVGYMGRWFILVNADAPPRRHTYYAAHELAHLWIHVDAEEGRDAVVYNFSRYGGPPDPREDDAEWLATVLCQGGRAL